MRQKGFTLVEIMVCITIIGILAAIAIPTYNELTAKARCAEVTTNFASYERMRAVYYQEYQKVSASLSTLGLSLTSPYFTYTEEVLSASVITYQQSGTAGNGNSNNNGNGNKVDICHYPPGNPDNVQVISVGSPAYDAHLAHGDKECVYASNNQTTNSYQNSGNNGNNGNSGSSGNNSNGNCNGNNANSANGSNNQSGNNSASAGNSSNGSGNSNNNSNSGSNSENSGSASNGNSNSSNGNVASVLDPDITLKAIASKDIGNYCKKGMGLYTLWRPTQTSRGDIASGTCSTYLSSYFAK